MDGNASYMNGFAPRDGEPLFPELWKDCVFAANPGLGPSGQTLRDWSGRGNHGTLVNGPTWGPVGGRQALSFDGVDDYVQSPGVSLHNSPAGTIAVWVRTTTINNSKYPISLPNTSAGTNGFDLQLRLSDVTTSWLKTTTDVAGLSIGGYPYADGFWHHFATTYDGLTHAIYYDGVLLNIASRSGLIQAASNELNIGRFGSFGAYLAGSVTNAGVWCVALRPDHIRTLATRPGIAYELAPQRYTGETVSSFNARLLARRNQIIGGGL